MRWKVLTAALLGLALAATSGPAAAARSKGQDDNLILPGKRVGEIYLRMPVADLLALMGAPESTRTFPDSDAAVYQFRGLQVTADDRVYWIVASGNGYQTEEGIGPGSEQIEVRSRLGKPKCAVTRGPDTIYDYGGLYLVMDSASGLVSHVGVRRGTSYCD